MTTTTCALCGYDNVPNTLFCEECGAALTASVARLAQSGPFTHEGSAFGGAIASVEHEVPNAQNITIVDSGAREVERGAPLDEGAAPLAVAHLTSEGGRRLDIPAQDVVIVGREDMRSGIRPDVDLTIDGAGAAGISRRHCRLLRHADGWLVEDLMSTNYTVLNGKALTAHTPTPIHDGDELRLGKLRLRFHASHPS